MSSPLCRSIATLIGAAFLGALLLAAVVQIVLSQTGGSPHGEPGACTDCHLTNPQEATSPGERVKLVKDVDTICRQCHTMDPGLSHPSNMVAGKKPPEELPLDWAGKITCATCHYMHGKGHSNATGYRIRTEKIGRVFCQQCHDDLANGGKGSHGGSFDRSHLAGDRSKIGSLFDDLSVQCLGCHDGTVAQAKAVSEESNRASWEHTQIGLSHPIGVDYPPRNSTKSQYRPAQSLDPRIRLFDGKLGCCSCHEPYKKEGHGLVMSNQKSALCLGCHLK